MSQPSQARSDVTPENMPALLQEYMTLQNVHKAVMFSLINKFAFVRVPKVANSTLKFSIYNNERFAGTANIRSSIIHDIHYGPVLRPGLVGFDSDILYRVLFTDEFFRFAFVRNPYARVLSNYLDRYHAKKSAVRRFINRTACKAGLTEDMSETLPFAKFVRAVEAMHPKRMEIHSSHQTTQLMLGLVEYHELCAFEDLENEWRRVASRLWKNYKPEFGNKSPSKTSAGEKLANYFRSDDIARVNRIYKKDFEMLGYPMLSDPAEFVQDGALLRGSTS